MIRHELFRMSIITNENKKCKPALFQRSEQGLRIWKKRPAGESWPQVYLAAETNYSRNELINLLLRHGVEHVEIE